MIKNDKKYLKIYVHIHMYIYDFIIQKSIVNLEEK